VPYLGVVVAVFVGLLLGLAQSGRMALITALVIFGVTRIADYLLVPKVMSESVGISPIAIIFAVFAGGELFGLWGLLLAIPGAALFKVLWNLWIHPWLTGRSPAEDVTSAPARTLPAVAEPMPAPSSLPGTVTDAR
jgi:predicted PurR-regulated permease PerM